MKFLEVVEMLQNEPGNNGYIVLVKNGMFFVGVGKDAVLLHDILGLEVVCIREKLCKVGIPEKSIEKYIGLLTSNRVSFVLYDYLKEENEKGRQYETIFRFSVDKVYEKRSTIKKCIFCKKLKDFKENNIIGRQSKSGKQ